MTVIGIYMFHAGDVDMEMNTLIRILRGDDQMIDMIDFHTMIFARLSQM